MSSIKRFFGGGSSAPKVVQVAAPDPTPTTVTSGETAVDTGSTSKKKRRGMGSTIIASDRGTIAAGGDGRKTLG